MTRISAPGIFKELAISKATDDLPEPELPAIPMMLISAHGGQVFAWPDICDVQKISKDHNRKVLV